MRRGFGVRLGTAQRAQQIERFRARELFAAESGDETSAANVALRFLSAQHRQQIAPRRSQRFARQEIAETPRPSADSNCSAKNVGVELGGRHRMGGRTDQRPAARGMAWPRMSSRVLHHGGAWDQSAPGGSRSHRRSPGQQPPVPTIHPRPRSPGGRWNAPGRRRRMRRAVRAAGALLAPDGDEDRAVSSGATSQSALSRRKIAIGAVRVGRTRRGSGIIKCRMRRQARPHHFAGQAQLIQELGLIARHAIRQEPPAPTRRPRSRSPAAA